MADFKVGDTVRLRSGGPLMTVENVINEDGKAMVDCVWFDEKNAVKERYFLNVLLEAESTVPSTISSERLF